MIKLNHLTKKFSDGTRTLTALNDVNLELPDHGLVFLLGKSGAGKSTLLNLLGGLDSFDGTIEYDDNFKLNGYNPREFDVYRSRHIGYIFQDFYLAEAKTVFENIRRQLSIAGITEREQVNLRIDRALKAVGMGLYKRRLVRALSLGQKQRIAIARALSINPQLLLADEPTGNLDSENSQAVMEILKKLGEKILVVCVTHSEPLATQFGDYLYHISDGHVTLAVDDKKASAPKKATKSSKEKDKDEDVNARDKGELSGVIGNFDTAGFIAPTAKPPLIVKGMFDKIIRRRRKGKRNKGYLSAAFLSLLSFGMAFLLCFGLNEPYRQLDSLVMGTILDPKSEVGLVDRRSDKLITDLNPQDIADVLSNANSGAVAATGATLTAPLDEIFDDLKPPYGGKGSESSLLPEKPAVIKIFNAGDGMPESFADPKDKTFNTILKDLQANEVAIDRSFADDLVRSLKIDNIDDVTKGEHYVNLYDAKGRPQKYRIAKIAEKFALSSGFLGIGAGNSTGSKEIFVGQASRFDPYWSAAFTNAPLGELYTKLSEATLGTASTSNPQFTGDLAAYIAGNSPTNASPFSNVSLGNIAENPSRLLLTGNESVDNTLFEDVVTAFTKQDSDNNLIAAPSFMGDFIDGNTGVVEFPTSPDEGDIPVYVSKKFYDKFSNVASKYGHVVIEGTFDNDNAPLLLTKNKQLPLIMGDSSTDEARFVSQDMDSTIDYLNKRYLSYKAVKSYDFLMSASLQGQRQMQIFIIIGAVLFLILYALFFRARLIKDVRLIGIYRCLGLKRTSIILHYLSDVLGRLTIFFGIPYVVIAAIIGGLGLFAMPVWIALVSVAAFFLATTLAVTLPIAGLLYKTPHRIMVKYDI